MYINVKGVRIDLGKANWRKRCIDGNCVEVAFVDGAVVVRDSKNPTGGVIGLTRDQWDAFVGGVKDGEFDLPT